MSKQNAAAAPTSALERAQTHFVQVKQRHDIAIEQHRAGCLALFSLHTAQGLLYLLEALRSGR